MEGMIDQNRFINLAFANLSLEEIGHFEKLARDFSKKTIGPMFDNDLPDGDFSYLDRIIEKAFETGIASSHREDMAGHEYGVWGKSTESSGMFTSIMILSVIAETCGGIAMGLHSLGVAVNILNSAETGTFSQFNRPALCFQDIFGMPFFKTIMTPAGDASLSPKTEVTEQGACYTLNGSKHFAYSLPGTDCFIVPARLRNSWCMLAVDAGAPGVTVKDAGRRTGLRASALSHVFFDNVRVPKSQRIDRDDALKLVIRSLCLDWIGMSAIAVGIARGAVRAAKQYASERYQGGAQIDEHPVIKSMLAEAESRARMASESVVNLKSIEPDRPASLRAAAMVKLGALDLCARAVTDSLQVFGGYGYMEDFGMEKRLRDVTVLKSAHGSPLYLRQIISDIEKTEATR